VKNTKYQDLRDDFRPLAFFPRAQEREPDAFMHVYIRTNGSFGGVVAAVKSRVAQTSPEIGIVFHVLKSDIHESLIR